MATRTKNHYSATSDGFRFEYVQRLNLIEVYAVSNPCRIVTRFTPGSMDTELDFQNEIMWFLYDNNALVK